MIAIGTDPNQAVEFGEGGAHRVQHDEMQGKPAVIETERDKNHNNHKCFRKITKLLTLQRLKKIREKFKSFDRK